ncbi:MAG: cell wall hydrolase [Bacillota bacterium]|jgi:N-acetylmuramoyl-L-alanine amidase
MARLLIIAIALIILLMPIPSCAAERYQPIKENITASDINTVARLVWLEARGESDEGQRAVVEVVFNRVMHSSFSDSISQMVYAKNQFSPAKRIPTTTATSKEYRNVYHVLWTSQRILPADVVYFSMGAQNPRVYTKIGCHVFCRIGG